MYEFRKMNLEYAQLIKEWRYEGFMKEIFMKPYFDNYDEVSGQMKGPGNCDGFAVFKDNVFFGLFEYYMSDEMEIGLAIHPAFVGQGYAKEFIIEGIKYGIDKYHYNNDYVKLSVEKGNIAAYKAYLKTGFAVVHKNDEEIVMKYYIKKEE